jgi:hypothetical protein
VTEDFDEARTSEHADPLDSKILDFDYDAVDGAGPVPIKFIQVDAACDGLKVIASYQLGNECNKLSTRAFEAIGRRVVAMWWAVNPAYFDGSPSLSSLAKRTGMDDTGLSRLTAELTRAFGVHNRAQAHGDGVRK